MTTNDYISFQLDENIVVWVRPRDLRDLCDKTYMWMDTDENDSYKTHTLTNDIKHLIRTYRFIHFTTKEYPKFSLSRQRVRRLHDKALNEMSRRGDLTIIDQLKITYRAFMRKYNKNHI